MSFFPLLLGGGHGFGGIGSRNLCLLLFGAQFTRETDSTQTHRHLWTVIHAEWWCEEDTLLGGWGLLMTSAMK